MQHLTVFILGLLCLSAVAANPMTDEQREQLIALVKGYMEVLEVKCLAKSGAEAALLERYKKGEDINDEKLRCFGACMLQELGFMDQAGMLQPEKAIQMIPADIIPRDQAENLINLCSRERGGDSCETAAIVFKCLRENKAMELLHIRM